MWKMLGTVAIIWCFASTAKAQPAAATAGDCHIWIDAKTGQPYPTIKIPAGSQVRGNFSGEGPPVVPGDVTFDPDHVHAYNKKTGQNLVRVPCPPPTTSAAQTPSVRARSDSNSGPYIGLGGRYFFEPGTQIGLIEGIGGYRLGAHFAVEVEVGIGVTKQNDDIGAFHSSTGISWTAIPYVVGIVPVASGVELFARAGYGAWRFNSSFGSGMTAVDSGNTVGVAAFGGGAQIAIGDRDRLRAGYTRLQFDNGSGANAVALTYVHAFGEER
jgi:outer membrane immunogenic protein